MNENRERIKGLLNYVRNGRISIDVLESINLKVEPNELFFKHENGRSLYSYIIAESDGQTALDRIFRSLINTLTYENTKKAVYAFLLPTSAINMPSTQSIVQNHGKKNVEGRSFFYWAALLGQEEVLKELIVAQHYELKDLLFKDQLGIELVDHISKMSNGKELLSSIFNQHFKEKEGKFTPEKLMDKTVAYWAFRLGRSDVIQKLITNGQISLPELFQVNQNQTSLLSYIMSFDKDNKLLDSLFTQNFKKKPHGRYTKKGEKNDNSALHWAVILRQQEALPELLENKKNDVNAVNNEGLTPLHFAAQYNHEMVDLLLKHGADPNAKTKSGVTPLFFAVIKNNKEAVKSLLKANATDCVVNDAKQLPFYYFPATPGDNLMILAAKLGRHDMISDLKAISDINYVSSYGTSLTPALCAIIYKQPGTLDQLINEGARLDQAIPSNNLTPWLVAAVVDDEKICAILRKHQAPANIPLTQPLENIMPGQTALHVAVKNNHLNVAEYLLADNNVLVNAADADGNTALHIAAINDYPEMIELLIAKDANVNQADKKGITPLMRFVQNSVDLATFDKFIKTYGADLKTKVEVSDGPDILAGDTVLQIAERLFRGPFITLMTMYNNEKLRNVTANRYMSNPFQKAEKNGKGREKNDNTPSTNSNEKPETISVNRYMNSSFKEGEKNENPPSPGIGQQN